MARPALTRLPRNLQIFPSSRSTISTGQPGRRGPHLCDGQCFYQDVDIAPQLLVLGFEWADTLLLGGQRLTDAGPPQLLCIDLATDSA